MKWALIFFVLHQSQPAEQAVSAISSVIQFPTERSCTTALQKIKDNLGHGGDKTQAKGVCVELQ